jgi:hypothetical protein
LAFWCSEPDGGQYAAINKGFEKTTGEIMGWLNSSDIYFPWTLSTIREIFEKFPDVQWITSLKKFCIQEDGCFQGMQSMPGFAARCYFAGIHGGFNNADFIQQETVFWRRELWEKIGSKIPDRCKYAADFHLWGEFFRYAPVYGVDCPLAAFRFHGDSRSANDSYLAEVHSLLREWGSAVDLSSVSKGFCTIRKTYVQGQVEWKAHSHSAHEYILLFNIFSDRFYGIFESIMWKCCEVYHIWLKAFYFVIRTVLWPIRKKPPWRY